MSTIRPNLSLHTTSSNPPVNPLIDTEPTGLEDGETRSIAEELDGATAVPSSVVERDLEKIGEQKAKLVTFEPGDPHNPRNWSKPKKWFVTMSVALLCFTVAFGSAIATGDLDDPKAYFQVNVITINLSITLFVIGFGLGPLFMAPLSEELGRRPVYVVSTFFYFIFTLPCALAKNIETLLVCRLIAGIAASCPMTNVGGSIADVWAVEERGLAMAFFSASIYLGPVFGPLVGGFVGETIGWRWLYWVLFIFVGIINVLIALTPETLGRVILKKRAAKLRKDTGDEAYSTEEELLKIPFAEQMKIALVRPLVMLVTEPLLLVMTFYLSFIYSILYLLFFAIPIVELQHNFNLGEIGLCFIPVMIGIFIALCFMPLQEKIYAHLNAKYGVRPEHRLTLMIFGALFLPASLFIFAWTSFPHVHWVGPLFGALLFGIAMVTVYIGANSYIIDSFSDFAASAIAAKTFLRSIVGAMTPIYVTAMYDTLHPWWASSLLAFVSIGLLPIPFYFFFYGPQVRARSKRATK